MPDFMDEAKQLADQHSDIADKGFDEAAQFADAKTGGRFDSQIQAGEQQAENSLGIDSQGNQDNQGQDNQGQGDQGQGDQYGQDPNQ